MGEPARAKLTPTRGTETRLQLPPASPADGVTHHGGGYPTAIPMGEPARAELTPTNDNSGSPPRETDGAACGGPVGLAGCWPAAVL